MRFLYVPAHSGRSKKGSLIATIQCRRRSPSPLTEGASPYRMRHYVAAAAMAKICVDRAASDLALAVRPDLKRFWNGKRLNSFLRAEQAIANKVVHGARTTKLQARELIRRAARVPSMMEKRGGAA